MNPLLELSRLPGFALLWKWTILLALGWAVHLAICSRDARWRLILWRGILSVGLVLPMVSLAPLPAFEIPVYSLAQPAPEKKASLTPNPTDSMAEPGRGLQAEQVPVEAGKTGAAIPALPTPAGGPFSNIVWSNVLACAWMAGAIYGVLRLARMMWQLSALRRAARPAAPELQKLVGTMLRQGRIRRFAGVLFSDAAPAPFAFGVIRPAIMMPAKLAQSLPPGEMMALLEHEIAHLRGHDLFWSAAWRWIKAIFWFHPFVWKIPAAHSLACEEEADRVASAQMPDRAAYARLLAQITLQVLGEPQVESQLIAPGNASIAQRLVRLEQARKPWRLKHSLAACGLVLAVAWVAAQSGVAFERTAAAAPPALSGANAPPVAALEDAASNADSARTVDIALRLNSLVDQQYGGEAPAWVKQQVNLLWDKFPDYRYASKDTASRIASLWQPPGQLAAIPTNDFSQANQIALLIWQTYHCLAAEHYPLDAEANQRKTAQLLRLELFLERLDSEVARRLPDLPQEVRSAIRSEARQCLARLHEYAASPAIPLFYYPLSDAAFEKTISSIETESIERIEQSVGKLSCYRDMPPAHELRFAWNKKQKVDRFKKGMVRTAELHGQALVSLTMGTIAGNYVRGRNFNYSDSRMFPFWKVNGLGTFCGNSGYMRLSLGVDWNARLPAPGEDAQPDDPLRAKVAERENRTNAMQRLRPPTDPDPAAWQERQRAYRERFERRREQDGKKYTPEQMAQIEDLYLKAVSSRDWGSPAHAVALQQLTETFPDANRTGCALLDWGESANGPEAEAYLNVCIMRHGDCYYGDGVQVGAFARFCLAKNYLATHKREPAGALFKEIEKNYPDAINHRGQFLTDLIK